MADDGTGNTPLIPRRVLLGNPSRIDPRLSPDGRSLAWLAPVDGVMNIWTAPTDGLDDAMPLTRRSGRPIDWHHWSADGRFVLFDQDETGDENYHLYVADHVTGDVRDLTPVAGATARLILCSPDCPGHVLIGINDRDPRWFDVWNVDLATGQRMLVHKNTERLGEYFPDSQGDLRLARRSNPENGNDEVLRFSGDGLEPWQVIPFEDVLTTGQHCINRAGSHYTMISSIGRNTSALIRVDLVTGVETVLVEHPKADVDDAVFDAQTFEPVAALADPGRQRWIALDSDVEATLEHVKADAPEMDFDITSVSEDNGQWIVAFWSPQQAVTYRLVDRKAQTITPLFDARPDLKPYSLAPMRAVTIKSRDGLDLVSYLTLPVNEPADHPRVPLPMVLLVHGGPWSRDFYGYNRSHQWLANRGYVVLSVNYRASTGFGKEFVNAGDKEHAGKIHDDLIDAVEWAIAEGIALREKVAIVGQSYGGYSAFVGATFTPEVFCCAIPIVGITDLVTLMENLPPYWEFERELFNRRYADATTEEGRAFLRSRSPLYKVENIKKPMLIGHGVNDVRCTLDQSDLIVAAMKDATIPVSYVVFPDEGHGFDKPENDIAFHAIAEAFLARHLGGRSEPVGNDFDGSSHELRAGDDILGDLGVQRTTSDRLEERIQPP